MGVITKPSNTTNSADGNDCLVLPLPLLLPHPFWQLQLAAVAAGVSTSAVVSATVCAV